MPRPIQYDLSRGRYFCCEVPLSHFQMTLHAFFLLTLKRPLSNSRNWHSSLLTLRPLTATNFCVCRIYSGALQIRFYHGSKHWWLPLENLIWVHWVKRCKLHKNIIRWDSRQQNACLVGQGNSSSSHDDKNSTTSPSIDYVWEQFGPRSGLTKCQAWSGSNLFAT